MLAYQCSCSFPSLLIILYEIAELRNHLLNWQFGEVLATTEHDEEIIIAEIDYSLMELRR